MKMTRISIITIFTLGIFTDLICQVYNEYIMVDTTSNRANVLHSFLGEHKKAIIAHDKGRQVENPNSSPFKKNDEDFNYLRKSALEIIDSLSRDVDIVMINEKHHSGQYRLLLNDLLPILERNGYHLLGVEALKHDENNLNGRGYPVLESGYFTRETVFGRVLRNAVKNGYQVFPYEADMKKYQEEEGLENPMDKIFMQMNYRDSIQALNIHTFIEANVESGKVILYGGYDHFKKGYDYNWNTVGRLLTEKYGYKTLSLNQTMMSESSEKKFESPIYRDITVEEPSVFISKSPSRSLYNVEEVVRSFSGESKIVTNFDVLVFLPRTTYVKNRPNWLINFDGNQHYKIDYKDVCVDLPLIAIASKAEEEYNVAVPYDVIVVESWNDENYFLLPEGKYHVTMKGANGDSFVTEIRVGLEGEE
jgi:hypothetical protein